MSDHRKKVLQKTNVSSATPSLSSPEMIDNLISGLPPVTQLPHLPQKLQALFEEQSTTSTIDNEQTLLKALPDTCDRQLTTAGTYRSIRGKQQPRPFLHLLNSLAAVLLVTALIGSAAVLFKTHLTSGNGGATPSSYFFLDTYSGPQANPHVTISAFDPIKRTIVWHTSLDTSLNGSLLQSKNLLTASATDGKIYLLNATNGAILWRYAMNNHASFSDPEQPHYALVSGENVYVGSSNSLYVLRLRDGSELWHKSIPAACQQRASTGKVATQEDCHLEVNTVISGVVYAFADSGLFALRATDGKVLWNNPQIHGGGSESFAGSFAVTNNIVYTLSNDPGPSPHLHTLRTSNGQEIKGEHLLALSTMPENVVAAAGRVYFMGVDIKDPQYPRAAVALDGSNQRIVWSHTIQATNATLLGISNGIVYLWEDQSPQIVALDARTGMLKWQTPLPSTIIIDGTSIDGQYMIINNKVYIVYPVKNKMNLAIVSAGKVEVHPISLP